MSSSSPSACTILDIPDEILAKIILYLDIRQRLPLANSCPRFESLVFEDKLLSKDLDFSKEGRLTTLKDIQQYFGNINTRKMVRRVNIQNVICMQPGRMLNNSIGKGINLVDVNVHGIKFKDIKQLTIFLELLIHVKRLSVDWPESKGDNVKLCSRFLRAPLGRLTYFSVKLDMSSEEFLPNFRLCQELEELRMVTSSFYNNAGDRSGLSKLDKLKNLKIVQVRGRNAMEIKNHLVNMLPDREEWTEFQLIDLSTVHGFYFEKNVKVCEALQKRKFMESTPYLQENPTYGMSRILISEYLLRNVIGITHEDVPKTFCCLTARSKSFERDREPCLLKIDEAKQLLKDPGYQISFLHFKHSIESHCDVHLFTSAFPNLTELILSHIFKRKDTVSTSGTKTRYKRRLRRRGSSMPEEQDDPINSDSSFEMLIENTPHLRDLTICAQDMSTMKREIWDLDALSLIPRWKNLTTLRLVSIPITDGMFLIDIGKECINLETLVLYRLRQDSNSCSYAIDLMQMLNHCKNLKELSIEEFQIDNIPGILASLSNIPKLGKLRLISTSETYEYYKLEELISSFEEVLQRCQKLCTLLFIQRALFRTDAEELESALKRIRVELNRPNLQFQTIPPFYQRKDSENVYKDASPFFFPCQSDMFD